jgi:hypothetical protein
MDNIKFKSKKRSNAAYFLLVTALTFIAGLGFLNISPQITPLSDDFEYYTLAGNIADGNGFSIDGQTPASYRPPLFSSLLGGWFYLTGSKTLLSGSIFQALIHAFSAGAAFLLFSYLFKSLYLALFLSLWIGLLPPHLSRIMLIMQEPLLTLLTTLSILLTLKFMDKPNSFSSIFTGIFWGLCTLAKSVTWFTPFLIALYQIKTKSFRSSKKHIALLFLSFFITLTPWAIRNYIHFNELIIVNAQGTGMLEWNIKTNYKRTLFSKNFDKTKGARLIKDLNEKKAPATEKKKAIWQFLKQNKAYFIIGKPLSGAMYFTFPDFFENWYKTKPSPSENYKKPIAYAWWLILTIPLFLVLFYRLIELAKRKLNLQLSFLVIFYLIYWAQYAIICGDPRYSAPVYPVLLCLLPIPFLKNIFKGKTLNEKN